MRQPGIWARLLAAWARRPNPATLGSDSTEMIALAERLAELRSRAPADLLTGLPLRHHFLAQLDRRLADPRGGGRALLLLRVPNQDVLNLRLGRDATNGLLCAVGHLLLTYLDRVPGAIAGRLNGSDFALFLPVAGVAHETAHSLRDALIALSALRSASISAKVGGVDGLPWVASGHALAEADAALARAEAGEGGGVVVDAHIDLQAASQGSAAWQWQVAQALDVGRVRLQATRVLDRQAQTLHLRCQPQLQLSPETAFQSARLGLALARRSGLLPRLEGLSVHLALRAIAADSQARCLRLGAPSLQTPGFADGLAAALRERPAQAARLSLLMGAPEQAQALPAWLDAAVAWRRAGTRVGVESSDISESALVALASAGVSFVTVETQHLRGLAADKTLIDPAARLLATLKGMGLAVVVDEALAEDDLSVAWYLGLDAAPVASLSEGAARPRLHRSGADARFKNSV